MTKPKLTNPEFVRNGAKKHRALRGRVIVREVVRELVVEFDDDFDFDVSEACEELPTLPHGFVRGAA